MLSILVLVLILSISISYSLSPVSHQLSAAPQITRAPETSPTTSIPPPTPSSTPTPTGVSPSPTSDEDFVARGQRRECFPADATVRLRNGSFVSMDRVRLGHWVETARGYSPVIFFTHRLTTTWRRFVRLRTASGKEVVLSHGHFIQAGGSLKTARDVRVGDLVAIANGRVETVKEVSAVWKKGLFNPHTAQGDILVGGVLVSCYTETVDERVAHALLAPVRWVFWGMLEGSQILPSS